MLENMIGSTTKVKLLRLFFEYPNRDFSTDEVLKNSFVGRGYAGKCLKSLLEAGVLTVKKIGKEKRYRLDKDSAYFPIVRTLFGEETRKYPTLSYIHRDLIADLIEKLDKETIILFGSVASGTATPESDIDLLIISERKPFVRKACERTGKKYRIIIQAIVFSGKELEKRMTERSGLLKNIGKEKIFVKGDETLLERIERV